MLQICPVRMRAASIWQDLLPVSHAGGIPESCDGHGQGQVPAGVAEAGGQVLIRSVCSDLATIQSRDWSFLKNLGDEANLLDQVINQAFFKPSVEAIASPVASVAQTQNKPKLGDRLLAQLKSVTHWSTHTTTV